MSTFQNVNVARFARNVVWDFLYMIFKNWKLLKNQRFFWSIGLRKILKIKKSEKILKKISVRFSLFSPIWMWYLITGASDVRRSRSRCRRQIKIMSIKVYKEVFLAAFSVWNDDVLCMFSSIRKYCSPSKINMKKSL